jgi:AcrR family transcriptional regulator
MVASARAAARPKPRRRPRRGGDGDGRGQIIEAAIASILEVGFYKSSTNEIARRADVSWGALQYHFGTREALLLAVLRELDRRFLEDINAAHVEGETVEERITSLYGILGRFYDHPTFLVRVQIILNLQHDPETSADVSAEVTQHAARAEASTRRLLAEAIGRDASQASYDALFHALRGFALSRQLSLAVPVGRGGAGSRDALPLFLHLLAGDDLGERPPAR